MVGPSHIELQEKLERTRLKASKVRTYSNFEWNFSILGTVGTSGECPDWRGVLNSGVWIVESVLIREMRS